MNANHTEGGSPLPEIAALKDRLREVIYEIARHRELSPDIAGDLIARLDDLQSRLGWLEQSLDAEAQERARLAALVEVAGIVNSSLQLPEVLNQVMDQIVGLTGAERAFLMLLEEETGRLVFQAARNLDRETITGPAFEISRSVVRQVAQEGRPVLTTDAQLDPRFRDQESVVSYNLRSILCVPLRVRKRVTGVIYADSRVRTGLFSEQDLALLSAFADQAAIAIENARLFESVTAAKALMENVFASIASGVVTVDEEGLVTLVNRAAREILNLGDRPVERRALSEVVPSLAPVLEPMARQVQREGQPIVGREVEVELEGRGRVTLRLSLSPLRDAEGKPEGFVLVVDDLTQQRRLEARERFIRETFQRYVSPAVVQRLLEDPESLRLGGTRQEVTVLFADIRGFTAFSERRDPEALVEVLNRYLALGATAVLEEEGTLDKFMGDAVMAIFNAPLPQPDHTLRAVRAALRLREATQETRQALPAEDRLDFGVGIAVGEAVVGNVGTAQQVNYTAIGACVNLAKRLQEHAAPGQILLSREVYERVRNAVEARALPPISLKGFRAPIEVYELLGLR
ncbi:MAG TPA: adenylate/guanylate cyclase domain-containing protein [Chloroflexi bacterium]|nr:adenylate/guanylate cyclase domain-containing protein [Chloroflexota bacterium]